MKRSPPDSTCLPGTRTTLLNSITAWVKSSTVEGAPSSSSNGTGWEDDYGYYHYHPPSIKPVVWLCGPVGCGKSAIAHIVAKVAEDEGFLAASFFFFRGAGDRSRIARLAATLASQIADAFPETLPHILDALKRSFSLQGASVETQFERLVYNPILAALGGRVKRPILIIIDGLDECEDRAEVEEFIDHMLSTFEQHPELPLRFFISSRIEEHIREHIEVDKVHVVNLRDHHSDKDISTLVRHTFKVVASRNRVIRSYGKWPSEDEICALIRHARGSFIFIRTLLNFILGLESTRGDGRTPMERFELALRMDPGLDELYTGVLQDALTITHSTNIILTLAMLKEPLSISNLARLLDIRPFEVANALIPLQSIVHVPGDDETRVTLFHTSLREFIRSHHRSHSIFQETIRSEHRNLLAQRCFQLRFQNKENGGNTFPYAVHYWADHWQDTYSDLKDLRARMDSIMAAARNVPAPIPLVLSMVPFEALIRTRRTNGAGSDFLFDWLSDAMGNPFPALHMVRQLVYPLYQSEEVAACDPLLHKCTVMHIMRCVMSHTWRRSYFWYIAKYFSWNVWCIVNTDEWGSDCDTASFLHTPYQQEHAPPDASKLDAGTAAFTATHEYIDLPRNDDKLEGATDIINRKVSHKIESLGFF